VDPVRRAVHEALNQAYRVAQGLGVTQRSRVVGRGASGDPSTAFDLAVEEAVIRTLRTLLPEALIVAEESGVSGSRDAKKLVLLDPVDGSTNASLNLPFYCTSIAVVDGRFFEGMISAGIVDLVRGELFYAERGKGVSVDGEPVSLGPSGKRLRDSCVSINLRLQDLRYGSAMLNLLRTIRYPRFLGSAALETAYVALGRVDAFVAPAPRLRSYDCLPSLLIVQEAGGYFQTLNRDLKDADLSEPLRLSYVAARSRPLVNWLAGLVEKTHSLK